MKKVFSLVASIACVLAVLSNFALSSTIKAQTQTTESLYDLLTKAGFTITVQNYSGTRIPQTMLAQSSSMSLNALPSLASYTHALIVTFTVDPAQLPSFQEKFKQFQAAHSGFGFNLVKLSNGAFQTTKWDNPQQGWTGRDIEYQFKPYFASLSQNIHIQTITALAQLTRVDKARIFYADLSETSPSDAEKLKELAQLDHFLKQKRFTVTIDPIQQEMHMQASLPVSLRDLPGLSFYKDKLAFVFIVDPKYLPHIQKKLEKSRGKYPSVSFMFNGFQTTRGWTNKDLNNFREEFRALLSNIYVTKISASLTLVVNILDRAQSYGLEEKHSPHPYVDVMGELIGAAKEALYRPIPVPYYPPLPPSRG